MKRNESDLTEDRAVRTLTRQPLSAGRVGTYAILGAAVGAVPVPWVPDALARRIRGALAQDIAGRHGLSLTPEARDILAEPSGTEGPRGIAAQAMRFLTRRVLGRFGPLGILPPVRAGVETFVLGHLLARYFEGSRTERAARVDVEEARRLRRAIEQAVVHAFSGDIHSPLDQAPAPAEELRDPITQIIDGALITAASIPGWILGRLEASFDDVLPRTHG
jgi:uncharacterized protein (DUF697 family)